MFLCFLGAASLVQSLGQAAVNFRKKSTVPFAQVRGMVPKLIVDFQGFAKSDLRLAVLFSFD